MIASHVPHTALDDSHQGLNLSELGRNLNTVPPVMDFGALLVPLSISQRTASADQFGIIPHRWTLQHSASRRSVPPRSVTGLNDGRLWP